MTYELIADDGDTRLTNTMDLEPRRRTGPSARPAASRIEKAVAENLAVLKRILETEDTEHTQPAGRGSG